MSAAAAAGRPLTAAGLGLIPCHTCGLLSKGSPQATPSRCARCGARVHLRKPDSIARTWALLTAAYLLYLPANILPIMETHSLFGAQRDTILSGIAFLWSSGSWPLAALVFFASVMVPLLKLIALTLLVASAQQKSRWRTRERGRLYRLVEFVGRWSMLDIYVVTVLVALVRIETLATIAAGPAALAFGAVVVLTMCAAMSFDPRLIWDPVEAKDD